MCVRGQEFSGSLGGKGEGAERREGELHVRGWRGVTLGEEHITHSWCRTVHPEPMSFLFAIVTPGSLTIKTHMC